MSDSSVPASAGNGGFSPIPAPGDWDYLSLAPIPFAAFVAEILPLYEPPMRSKHTLMKMRQVLKIVSGLVGPAGTTADLTPATIARLIESRPEDEATRTTHALLAYVRSACSYAKSRGYIRTSPFEFRRRWIRLGEPAGKTKHHSMEEIRRVLELLTREVEESLGWPRWRARRLLALASTFAYTGLRRDEGLMLHVADVDLDGRMIHLVERKGRRLKTEASARPVPIPAALVPVLEDWLSHRMDREAGALDFPFGDCPWLFPNVTRSNAWTGGSYGDRACDHLKAAGERAHVQGLTFLSFRHSFATHAEAWGLSLAMLQRVLRHTSLGTQAHYRHADLDNMREAVDRIDFAPPAPPAPAVPPASAPRPTILRFGGGGASDAS